MMDDERTPTTLASPVSGPLSVTPLYTSSGDDVVWWDGAAWNEVEVAASGGGPGAYIEAAGGSITLSDGVAANLTSITLPAGDWIVNGSAYFNTGNALNFNSCSGPAPPRRHCLAYLVPSCRPMGR
jgi:hypothetical protein